MRRQRAEPVVQPLISAPVDVRFRMTQDDNRAR
jgi:hypothetical protein